MNFLDEQLSDLGRADLRRALRRHRECPGRFIEVDGARLRNFSSNNYLGLAGSPSLAAAAAEALSSGTGSTASRLVTGNLDQHEALEAEIAQLHGLPAARLFGSGYQANVGLLSCLAGPTDLVISDRLNHASIIDGIRLSKAKCKIAEHVSVASVAGILRDAFPGVAPWPGLGDAADDGSPRRGADDATSVGGAVERGSALAEDRVPQNDATDNGAAKADVAVPPAGAGADPEPQYRRCFVVTDSVFSMDGDIAPLRALRSLCSHYGAFLVVDEAHAAGALGSGRGLCHDLGVVPDALTGGFGKAFGSYGGYVAGSEALCEVLLNRARSFVFSTALPPAVLGASRQAIRLVLGEEGRIRRERLAARIAEMTQGLRALAALEPGAGHSPIFPFLVGAPAPTLALTERLKAEGYFCQAIRPPTVPVGTSRLRIALSAEHEPEDVAGLLSLLAGAKR